MIRDWRSLALGLCVAIVLPLAGASAMAAPLPTTIDVVTEEFPPFQYTEDGVLVGPATEVVRAVLDDAKVKGNFLVLPWARAMMRAQAGENVAIFAMDRSPEREHQFQWIGQITIARNFVYAVKTAGIKIATLEEAKKYAVGTVIGDIREAYFIKHGFGAQENIASVATHEQNYLKLKAGRISLWPMNDLMMNFIVRKMGGDPDELESLLEITDMSAYTGSFLAMSRNSSEQLVFALRRSLERIKSDGKFAAIQAKWSGAGR